MKKVLVIEDDTYSAQSLTEQLSDTYAIHSCRSADEGVQDAQTFLPDVILLDIMLFGKKNGFDALRELRQHETTAQIPVIMLTNLDDQKTSAIESGADDCLVKANTTIAEIQTAIEKALTKTHPEPKAIK